MQSLHHPNVVGLKEFFYHKRKGKDEVYLNVVMDFVPDTIYRAVRNCAKNKDIIPIQNCRVLLFASSIPSFELRAQNLIVRCNARRYTLSRCAGHLLIVERSGFVTVISNLRISFLTRKLMT